MRLSYHTSALGGPDKRSRYLVLKDFYSQVRVDCDSRLRCLLYTRICFVCQPFLLCPSALIAFGMIVIMRISPFRFNYTKVEITFDSSHAKLRIERARVANSVPSKCTVLYPIKLSATSKCISLSHKELCGVV